MTKVGVKNTYMGDIHARPHFSCLVKKKTDFLSRQIQQEKRFTLGSLRHLHHFFAMGYQIARRSITVSGWASVGQEVSTDGVWRGVLALGYPRNDGREKIWYNGCVQKKFKLEGDKNRHGNGSEEISTGQMYTKGFQNRKPDRTQKSNAFFWTSSLHCCLQI